MANTLDPARVEDFRRFWQANPEAVATVSGTAGFYQRFVGTLDDANLNWSGIVSRFHDVARKRGLAILAIGQPVLDGDGFIVWAIGKRD